ncbi:hypothetical protein DFH08DRAFT_801899 [Mycena albidolilacea]|uniref:Uncharacterized protein n=1 Tax=Mycena albidolilacea TaxID=1033008 RepID=A0AAD7F0F5_9AGAR|nr:hypothetical protein DFH08DRAFT_801899 [Mycena albidolilacea]
MCLLLNPFLFCAHLAAIALGWVRVLSRPGSAPRHDRAGPTPVRIMLLFVFVPAVFPTAQHLFDHPGYRSKAEKKQKSGSAVPAYKGLWVHPKPMIAGLIIYTECLSNSLINCPFCTNSNKAQTVLQYMSTQLTTLVSIPSGLIGEVNWTIGGAGNPLRALFLNFVAIFRTVCRNSSMLNEATGHMGLSYRFINGCYKVSGHMVHSAVVVGGTHLFGNSAMLSGFLLLIIGD